ncbi:DUF4231 domain-containing protein [Streptomyces longwoodensis]|uniref:DUF4231 domain-containing protein n=1 Tax=Streptomyces longwoodensis TaxID=68231 RepID=UPI0033C83599
MVDGLHDDDLPAVFRSSDSASLVGQRNFARGTMWRLLLAVAAAVFGAVSGSAALVCLVVVFVAALCVEVWLLAERPELAWYDGRALAESAKTLAWRYAVGGAPYPVDLPANEVRRRFHERIEVLLREAPPLSLAPVGLTRTTGEIAATGAMNALRSRDFNERKQAYLKHRIQDQLNWYASKASINIARSRASRLSLIALEGLGVTAAVVRLLHIVTFDLAGILAAVLGAGTAWAALRQYETLGRAYTFAATELGIIYDRLTSADEDSWAQEVADAEEAISREHTMWRASRGAS